MALAFVRPGQRLPERQTDAIGVERGELARAPRGVAQRTVRVNDPLLATTLVPRRDVAAPNPKCRPRGNLRIVALKEMDLDAAAPHAARITGLAAPALGEAELVDVKGDRCSHVTRRNDGRNGQQLDGVVFGAAHVPQRSQRRRTSLCQRSTY